MSKATTKGTHWLPRASQYSLHGQRNGRVDVLPPGATDPLYEIARQIADGKKRILDLRAEKDELLTEIHEMTRVDHMRDRLESGRTTQNQKIGQLRKRVDNIQSDIRKTQHGVGQLNALLGARQEVTFEGVFVQLAKAQLSEDTWRRLSDQAAGIVSRSKEGGK